ncbi:MAG TPA: Gfo/Idh/MocA family oxidoreductase [Solirubrobacteraceae bacterium]|jgi:1,5-anhydro-D-fructose reductase (1,5-anhydro-D-mannitol-forming)|nr:Gfo/Idh/MocA family oxidoreductase [Solirubrobacteraceae bacterium]
MRDDVSGETMKPLGWGFVGASLWARERLVPAVQATDGAEPVAVFSTSTERGQRFARDCGVPRAYDALDDLLADPDIDIVYVSTTNDLHAPQTIAAAAAGKHVLCEKPIATTLADAREMVRACELAGVVLAVNHHLRGAATIGAIRQLLQEGALGDLVSAHVAFLSLLPVAMRSWRLQRPEAGGGVVLDLTVHSADTIRSLLGDEIVEVTAVTSSGELGNGVVEDTAMGVMRTGRGPLVGFHDSFAVPHASNELEIHGTEGSVFARDVLGPDPIGRIWLRRGDTVSEVEVPRRWPLYENAVRRFMAAVRGEGTVLASGRDGVASLAVALATLESARERRPVGVVVES